MANRCFYIKWDRLYTGTTPVSPPATLKEEGFYLASIPPVKTSPKGRKLLFRKILLLCHFGKCEKRRGFLGAIADAGLRQKIRQTAIRFQV
ncbi:MAG: hypothetical protein DRH11_06440 [Deltaproteobacteria bacterium]|nr:MAG: hypothetical protein DRH11_06440 [Deltaproteobacteria bacterium]